MITFLDFFLFIEDIPFTMQWLSTSNFSKFLRPKSSKNVKQSTIWCNQAFAAKNTLDFLIDVKPGPKKLFLAIHHPTCAALSEPILI